MRNPDIIRAAARNDLIGSPEDWLVFRRRRNATSHECFDEDAIELIIVTAPAFHIAVNNLLDSLCEGME